MTTEFIQKDYASTEDPSSNVVERDLSKSVIKHDSAYGSLESSSNGQSQRSSYGGSGSKSLNSGSSHSSGYGEQSAASKETSSIETGEDSVSDNLKAKENLETNNQTSQDSPEIKEVVNTEVKLQSSEKQKEFPEESCGKSFHGYRSNDNARMKARSSLVYKQALNYIRKIKETSAEQGVPFSSPYIIQQLSTSRLAMNEFFKSFSSLRGFTIAINIQDGTVLQVSPSITDILEFPKDMLLGHSFIDFLYPKDSINFSSKIINGLSIPFRKNSINDNGTTFYCRLRKYHGLRRPGYEVRPKSTIYIPCKIIFRSQDPTSLALDENCSFQNPYSSLIIVEIIPIEPVYKVPDESPEMGVFNIRHSASCNFSDYDPEAIPFLGYLPQDLTGNSIFDCYHPEDFQKLKTIYEEIVKHQGKPYRSESYRFRTFNNSWVTLTTEWLCFVNPWTRKIESIIGRHRVLKGPKDIAIFLEPIDKKIPPFPEDLILEAQKSQIEILDLLQKPIAKYEIPSKRPYVKRRLAHSPFMEPKYKNHKKSSSPAKPSNFQCVSNIIQKNKSFNPTVNVAETFRQQGTKHKTAAQNRSPQQSNTTPGQESLNSSVETHTPSSYGQLNYSATLQRFFRSNPKTVSSSESGEGKMENSQKEYKGGETSNRKSGFKSPVMQTPSGSSGSEDNNYDSASFRYCTSNDEANGSVEMADHDSSPEDNSCYMPLTIEILNKHNQDMQRQFMNFQKNYKNNQKKPLENSKHTADKAKHTKKFSKRARERLSCLRKYRDAKESEMKFANMISRKTNISSMLNKAKGILQTLPPTRLNPIPMLASAPVGVSPFQGLLPNYFIPNTVQEPTVGSITSNGPHGTASLVSQSSCSYATATPIMVASSSPAAYVQSPALPVHPIQYVSALPSVIYQPVGPPLLNTPPVMLPNVVYQHTLIQPSRTVVTQAATSHMPGKRKASPSKCSSYDNYGEPVKDLHQAPSICRVSHISKSTSLFADCASAKSLGKNLIEEPSSDHMSFNTLSEDGGEVINMKGTNHEEKTESFHHINYPKKLKTKPTLGDAPWLENVTPETLLRYQLKTQELVDVLRDDMEMLKKVNQSSTVDDQLASLYEELELEGESTFLHLEEGLTSSSSDDLANNSQFRSMKAKDRSSTYYSKLSMLYESEAPLPSA